MAKRVVVTGIGLVTPLGLGAKHVWKRLINGETGISGTNAKGYGYSELPCRVAGFVPRGDGPGMFNPDKVLSKSEAPRLSSYTAFAMAASELALNDAGYPRDVLDKLSDNEKDRMGIYVGVALMEIDDFQATLQTYNSKGCQKISPFVLLKQSINLSTGNLSIRYGFRGPTISVTNVDSSSAYSIGSAFRIVRDGLADFMLAGGSETHMTPDAIAIVGRNAALSTRFNDSPEASSRPFDRDRDGLVLSEGSAVVTLEEYEKAKARGAHIYCEVIGFGMSGDGREVIDASPPKDGKEAYRAMEAALEDAKQNPEAVSYVNAHAVSSTLGDAAENHAIVKLLGSNKNRLAVSSIKGATGTILGAAGGLDAAITALALETRELPPTINLHNLDSHSEFPLNYVPNEAQQLSSDGQPVALSNSFGLGGSNACLCFRAI